MTFLWLVVANAVAGYVVVVAFSSVGLFATPASSTEPAVHQLVMTLHGGTGGGDDDVVFAFFALLMALIVAGAIIGAVAGAALGSFSGAGLWVFDINHAVHGATQGATVNWLIGKREAKTKADLLLYTGAGAVMGAGEGLMVGALAGAMFDAFHIVG